MNSENIYDAGKSPFLSPLDDRKPFDADIDITPADWKEIEGTLRELRQRARFKPDHPWRRFAELAADSRELGHAPSVFESDWSATGGMLDAVETFRHEPDQWKFPLYTAALSRLDPGRDFGLIESDQELVERKIQEYRNKGEALFLSKAAVSMGVVFPGQQISLEETDRETMQTELERTRVAGEWGSFIALAANMKKLYPQSPPVLNTRDWREIRHHNALVRKSETGVGYYPMQEFAAEVVAMRKLAK
jgi:hypothetical protein